MQIVIEIDEDTYRYMRSRCKYQNKGDKGLSKFEKAGVAIKNGTILPKGHGRLIDADALENLRFSERSNVWLMDKILKSDTIVKADQESEVK